MEIQQTLTNTSSHTIADHQLSLDRWSTVSHIHRFASHRHRTGITHSVHRAAYIFSLSRAQWALRFPPGTRVELGHLALCRPIRGRSSLSAYPGQKPSVCLSGADRDTTCPRQTLRVYACLCVGEGQTARGAGSARTRLTWCTFMGATGPASPHSILCRHRH